MDTSDPSNRPPAPEAGFLKRLLIYRSPVRLLVLTIATIGLMEVAVMAVLAVLPALPAWVDNAVDAGLLVGLIFPLLYFFVFRPFIRHVDASHRVEMSLRESEERLRLLVDTAVDAIVRMDAAGRIIGWNDSAETVFGWRASEVLHRPVADILVPARDRDAHQQGLKRYLATGAATRLNTRIETRGLHRSGREVPIELALAAIETADGPVFSAFIRDITERKRIEENLLLAAKVFENSGEGITVTGPDNRIIAVNPAFTEITGYTLAEAQGKNPNVLKSGRHGDTFYRDMWAALETSGHWQGEIWNRRKSGEIYPEWLSVTCVRNPKGEVVNYFATFADITTRKAAAERIEHMAHYDQLTGLPNRALLKDRLDQALARARRHHMHLAVLFLDLDRFKPVNDTYGHEVGDDVLTEVARRLRGIVREEDTVSRIGGDEFVILLPGTPSSHAAETVASKAIAVLSQPFHLRGHDLQIGTSVGIALYPDGGRDGLALMRAADGAMYRAKQDGRGTWRVAGADAMAS